MKNPLTSIKKLRNRVRGQSRADLDATSSQLHETSPESDTSTPAHSVTPNASMGDGRVSPQERLSSETGSKKRLISGGLLKKAKAAVTKSVKFAGGGTDVKTPLSQSPDDEEIDQGTHSPEPAIPDPFTESPHHDACPTQTENGVEGNEDIKATPSPMTPTTPSPFSPPSPSEPIQESLDQQEDLSEKNIPEAVDEMDTIVRPRETLIETTGEPEAKQQQHQKHVEQGKIYDVHGGTFILAVLGIVTLFWMMIFGIFGVGMWETAWWSFVGFGVSMGTCYLYGRNVGMKATRLEMLNVTPGVYGLRSLFSDVPTWLSYTKKERVEWLNKAMKQMWPAYDKAVCEAIKESVEPIMQSVKPPIFKDIRFTRLRFGDVPFRVEGVEIFDITENEIVLDIDIRWCGDSNITLAIEPNIPSMTEVTRMQPKMTNISCYGTLRLIFKPLVSEMPGFGAIVATFVRAPVVRFNMDFGKALGGSVSGNMVKTALDSFIRDTLVNMYVWPQRYVTPIIYDEAITGPIEDLQLRHVGVLTVKVLEARNLPAADLNGTSDPTIELWTRPERKYNTAVIKKTLNPVWDKEIHHLLIQEPRSQHMCITASDVDFLNVTDVFKSLNIIKSLKESIYAKEFLGRAMISVRPIADRPGEEIDDWYDLGSNAFSHPYGTGTGCGRVHLKMIYTPFSMLDTLNSKSGAVIINVVRCRDLMAMDRCGTSDPYVRIKLQEKTVKTHVVNATCDPEFHTNFEFFDVPITETVHFSLFDRDFATRDDPIGSLDISIRQLAANSADGVIGTMRQWFKLSHVEHGDIQLKLQYIPMDIMHQFGA